MSWVGRLPFLYQQVLKPVLFRLDPERVHDGFVALGDVLGRTRVGRGILSAEDAMEKFRAGADLVHHISGFFFTGPHLMGEIAGAWARQAEG